MVNFFFVSKIFFFNFHFVMYVTFPNELKFGRAYMKTKHQGNVF